MTTHAAALRKQIASEIKHLGSLGYAIASVTLLAPGFGVLFLEHGPQPEAMATMSLGDRGGGAAITPVTTCTTKFFRIVSLKDFAVRMADKRTGPTVRRFAWSIGRHVGSLDSERLPDSSVAYFAAIDDLVSSDTDLMTEDRIVVVGDFVLQAFDGRGT